MYVCVCLPLIAMALFVKALLFLCMAQVIWGRCRIVREQSCTCPNREVVVCNRYLKTRLPEPINGGDSLIKILRLRQHGITEISDSSGMAYSSLTVLDLRWSAACVTDMRTKTDYQILGSCTKVSMHLYLILVTFFVK